MQTLFAGVLTAVIMSICAGCGALGEEDTTPPDPPSDLTGESGDAAITLTWSTVDAGDLKGYNVYRAPDSIGEDVEGMNPVNESVLSDTTGYRDEGAENGTTYYYVVTAVDNASNESDPSGQVEKTPFDNPPDRP